MAGQGLFCKILGNSRFLLNRVVNVNVLPAAGLKQETKNLLKELKVPEKPKKPLTAYLKFIVDHRPTVAKEHPEWKATQVMTQCAVDWSHAHATIKQKYQDQYKVESEEYDDKLLRYNESLTPPMREALKKAQKEDSKAKEKRQNKKLSKETGKPKRPLHAFGLYLFEKYKNTNKKMVDMYKENKGVWETLPAEEKRKYEDIYAIEKEKYNQELAKWEAHVAELGHEHLLTTKTKKEHKQASKSPRRLKQ